MSFRKVFGFSLFKSPPSISRAPSPPYSAVRVSSASGPSISPYHTSPISLSDWEGQPRRATENDEDWVIIPTTEQKEWERLKAQHQDLQQQFTEAGGEDSFCFQFSEIPHDMKAAITDLTQENHRLQTLLTQLNTLDTLVTLRDSLIKKIKADKNYSQHFDDFLSILGRLSDKSIDIDKATYYTEQVNMILQLLLIDKPRYLLFMQLAQDKKALALPIEAHFIHSQAVQLVVFLLITAYTSLYELPQLQMQHMTLIDIGKQLTIGLALFTYLESHPTILTLKSEMSWGAQCQFNASVLYKAQSFFNLPFKIEPLAELIEVPDSLIDEALAHINKDIQDFRALSHRLYTMAFWQHYLVEGYKQDPTLKKTSLLKSVCDRAEQAHQEKVAIGKLHKKRQKKLLNDREDDDGIYQLLVLAIKEVLKQKIKPSFPSY